MSGAGEKCLVAWVPVGEMRALFSQEMDKADRVEPSRPKQSRPAAKNGRRRDPMHGTSKRRTQSVVHDFVSIISFIVGIPPSFPSQDG